MSKVSVIKTTSNDFKGVDEAVRKAIENIGGIKDIVKPGFKVLIKPNLVAVPKERLSGAITRWEVCKSIADLVIEAGGKPFIAESSAAGVNTESVIVAGEYDKLRELGYEVLDLKKSPRGKIAFPEGKIVQELDTWEAVASADAIISVPIMKTHDQTEVTLGLKNLKGLIQDTQKKLFHSIGVVGGVVDIIQAVKPVLCVIDGTIGQEGLGPIFGEPVKMDLIIASKDMVSCDAVASVIMGYEVDDAMITREAYERGIGEKNLDKIEIIGEKIENVKRRFKRACETKIEGLPPHELIMAQGACTGCRNTVISALMDMKDQNLLKHLEGKIICVGPVQESDLPANATPENTVLIGKCTNHLKGKGRNAVGCPPGNVFVVQAIVGDAAKVERRYAAE